MKMLIVNYYYPPVGRAHSFKWQQIAKKWALEGHDITFVTSKHSGFRKEDSFILDEIGFKVSKERFERPESKNNYKAIVLSFLRVCYRKFYWPDGLWFWSFPLFLKMFKLRNKKFDYVITYSPTFTSHLGGFFLKKISKHSFCWISDYGDPFSISESMQPNNFNFYRKFNGFVEKRVLKNSNKVIFTNKMTRSVYKEKFGSFNSEVIPHTIDVDKFYAGNQEIDPHDIRLVYIGSFHKKIREPYKAIEAINKIITLAKQQGFNILFDIYGPMNGLDISNVKSSVVRFFGSISRELAIKKIKSASFLIHIENSNCVMTPSKSIEYLATGIPIINFYDHNLTEIFVEKSIVLNIQTEQFNVFEAMSFMTSMLETRKNDKSKIITELKDYTLDSVAKRYLS